MHYYIFVAFLFVRPAGRHESFSTTRANRSLVVCWFLVGGPRGRQGQVSQVMARAPNKNIVWTLLLEHYMHVHVHVHVRTAWLVHRCRVWGYGLCNFSISLLKYIFFKNIRGRTWGRLEQLSPHVQGAGGHTGWVNGYCTPTSLDSYGA